MAAPEHNPSRRALLGAAAALPLVGVPGTNSADWIPDQVRDDEPDQVRDDEEWKRALAAFRAAEAELRAFERRTAGLPWEAQEAVEREMDEHLEALAPALLRLLETPAPDLEAVLAKMALIEAHEGTTLTGGEDCLAALMRDVRRALGSKLNQLVDFVLGW